MKKTIITLFIIGGCFSAHGQFFSKAEKAENNGKPALKSSLPDAEQKAVFMEICTAAETAHAKSEKLYPIKIQQTPEKREEQQKKAQNTRDTLFKLYKEEIAEAHGISTNYLAKIETMGKESHWPEKEPQPDSE
jgi:hypothetical protein